MSTQIRLLAAGLTALGLSASAYCLADAPAPAPSPAATDAPSPPTVLLLSNGQVLQGRIVEVDTGYVVHHKIGVIHKRRRDVAGAFATIQEAYAYKLAQTPPRDPAERMKLARWCLDQKLAAEAKAQLEGVLALEPDDPQARAMLANLAAVEGRTTSGRDLQVARTAAEVPAEPAPLSLDEVRRRKGQGPIGPPVVLDLPPALAVRRYQEFAREVHPLLQRRCARCHNEQTKAGSFQLLQVRSRRDAANDLLLRTNLDATMAQIDGSDPSNSPLLNLAFKPHGRDPKGPTLFTGPNDPSYRLLSAWVNSLRAPHPVASEPRPSGFATTSTSPSPAGPGFATDRGVAKAAHRPATKTAPAPRPDDLYQAPLDAQAVELSPLVTGEPTPPADGSQYLRAPDGSLVLDDKGKPIPVVNPNAPAKTERKGKAFHLNPAQLQNILKNSQR